MKIKYFLLENEIIKDIIKKKAAIGKAEGKKNMPAKNNLLPKVIFQPI